jgi:hypothetical protein
MWTNTPVVVECAKRERREVGLWWLEALVDDGQLHFKLNAKVGVQLDVCPFQGPDSVHEPLPLAV